MDWGALISLLFSIKTLLIVTVGVLWGMIAGALPGISSTMAVSLMLPFTFSMGADISILLLATIYTAAVYGGSLTAILLNTPGTGSSAATAIDGYALTQQGKAAQALRISTFSSALGGVVSALALLLLAPPLSKVALSFGPPEYFLLTLIGLSAVASLAADNLIKGVLAAVFGLVVTTIGIDYTIGYPRFTFGILNLESGISFIPALIGLFALSEVLKIVETKNLPEKTASTFKSDRILPTRKELTGLWGTLCRGSIIGVIIGILPGAGAEIGSWVSYNTAKQVSRNRDKIGHGSLEGVAASEVANNAVTGAALIPLLTLGIPGSSVAAVIMGGLMIQGLIPGHNLFTEQAQITYTFMFGFLLANILMGVYGLLLVKTFALVTRIPRRILVPIIVSFCFIGAFAINNNLFDIGVMVLFGMIGYVMQKAGFHPAPVVLAMVLGPMAESRYLQTYTLSDGKILAYLFSRPLSILLMIITALFLISPIFFRNVQRSSKKISSSVHPK